MAKAAPLFGQLATINANKTIDTQPGAFISVFCQL
jgi:hypothetical protein